MIRSFENARPQIATSAYVDETALIIGDVVVGENSSVWPMSVIRGDIHHIRIGKNTNIQDGSVLHVTHDSEYKPGGSPLLIGDDVTIGHQVTLHACTIEDASLVGMGSIVLDDAVIESGALLGAGSLVNPGKHIEGGYLWLGRPARRVRELTEKERAYLNYSAEHYVRLQRRYQVSPPA
jgi:carbonic anhydrase/acetyltransferase-like protein (isoleucine patch superfamily)